MKNILVKYGELFFLLFFTNSFLIGQENHVFAGFSAGPNFPQRNFAVKGYAKTGFNVNSFVNYKLSDYFGIIAMLHLQANNVYNDKINSTIEKSGEWNANGFMLGAIGSLLPDDCNGNIEAFGLIGFIHTMSPSLNSLNVYQAPSSSISFAGLFGMDLRFDLSKKLSLIIQGDIFLTNWKVKTIYITNSQLIYLSIPGPYSQKILTTNLSIGLIRKIR